MKMSFFPQNIFQIFFRPKLGGTDNAWVFDKSILENAVLLGFIVSTTLLPGKTFRENLVDTIMVVSLEEKMSLQLGRYGNAWVFVYPPR